jgi:hypothetical protein
MDTTPTTSAEVADLFRSQTCAVADEGELHGALLKLLRDHLVPVQDEARLNPKDRIDMIASLGSGMLGVELGIELKVKGAAADVHRQVRRYAADSKLDEVMLVTTMRRHLIGLPRVIGRKPVRGVLLRGRW